MFSIVDTLSKAISVAFDYVWRILYAVAIGDFYPRTDDDFTSHSSVRDDSSSTVGPSSFGGTSTDSVAPTTGPASPNPVRDVSADPVSSTTDPAISAVSCSTGPANSNPVGASSTGPAKSPNPVRAPSTGPTSSNPVRTPSTDPANSNPVRGDSNTVRAPTTTTGLTSSNPFNEISAVVANLPTKRQKVKEALVAIPVATTTTVGNFPIHDPSDYSTAFQFYSVASESGFSFHGGTEYFSYDATAAAAAAAVAAKSRRRRKFFHSCRKRKCIVTPDGGDADDDTITGTVF